MHVMVTVVPLRSNPVQTPELVHLGRGDIFERSHEYGVKQNLSETMPQKASGDSLLVPSERGGAAWYRKGCREVQMKAGIDAPLARQSCGALRILHEHHGADRRDRSSFAALQGSIRDFAVSSPVVSIDHEAANVKRRDWRTRRHGRTWFVCHCARAVHQEVDLRRLTVVRNPFPLVGLRLRSKRRGLSLCICSRLRNATISLGIGLSRRCTAAQK